MIKEISGRKAITIITIILTIIVLVGISTPLKANAKKKDNSQSVSDFVKFKQGDLITFGSYEQDNNEKNGKEPIEWVVLKTQNDKALLLSRHVLEYSRFNAANQMVSWANSTLRTWLNKTFYNDAFNKTEKDCICETLNNDVSKDNIFILSADDLQNNEYGFDLEGGPESIRRTCMSTFHVSDGKWNRTCSWWVNTIGEEENSVVYVDYAGGINKCGTKVDSDNIGVRPAMWIQADNSQTKFVENKKSIAEDVLEGMVKLGTWQYRYDDDGKKIPVEWIVLDVKDGKALLLSKYVLDYKKFNETDKPVTWENSTLRKWLNEDFCEKAFDKNEIRIVSETNNRILDNWYTFVEGGEDTMDRLFVLSTDDIVNPAYGLSWPDDIDHDDKFSCWVHGCWEMNSLLMSPNGDYGVYTDQFFSEWWTKTPGDHDNTMIYVRQTYTDHYNADDVVNREYGIRPAMWIDIPLDESLAEDCLLKRNTTKDNSIDLTKKLELKDLKRGDSILFGSYEQDLVNGSEPIEWKIIAVSGKKALLLSNNILRFMKWDLQENLGESSAVTWKDSIIRRWLNDDFYKSAFRDAEKMMILETDNTYPANTSMVRQESGGSNTKDRCFLLSIDDVLNSYYGFSSDRYYDTNRVCKATEYAIKHGGGSYNIFNGGSDWYLRSPGYDQDWNESSLSKDFFVSNYSEQAIVISGFGLGDCEGYIDSTDSLGPSIGVRPAIWIELPEEAEDTVQYNRDEASRFAKEKYNDGRRACAGFVARCLAAGGLSQFGIKNNKYGYDIPKGSSLGDCGTLREELLKGGLSTEIIPKQKGYLNKKDYPEIQIGDVVIWKNHDGKGDVWVHAAIISDFDSKGNALYSMHNNPYKDKKFKIQSYWGVYYTKTKGVTYDKGHVTVSKEGKKTKYYSRLCDLYVYHIND